MKTVYEIETFLKRAGYTLRLEPPTGAGGKFGVAICDGSSSRIKAQGVSANLADAIENAMIELRANGTKPPPTSSGGSGRSSGGAYTWSQPIPAVTNPAKINGPVSVRTRLSPCCTALPRDIYVANPASSQGSFTCDVCSGRWVDSVSPGDVFQTPAGSFKWDGGNWSKVTP